MKPFPYLAAVVLFAIGLLFPLGAMANPPEPNHLQLTAPAAPLIPAAPTVWSQIEKIVEVTNPTGITAVELDAKTHLIWGDGNLLYHAYQLNTGWIVNRSAIAVCKNPSAVAENHMIHVVCDNVFAGNGEIYYIIWDGVRWSLPQNVSYTTGPSNLAVIVTSNGIVYATWQDGTPGYLTSYIAYKPIGDRFWSNRPIPSGRGSVPYLAITPNGTTVVACWTDQKTYAGIVQSVFCSLWGNDGWTAPELISTGDSSVTPGLSMATAKTAVALVWEQEWEINIAWQNERYEWTYPVFLGLGEFPRVVSTQNTTTVTWFDEGQFLLRQATGQTWSGVKALTLAPGGGYTLLAGEGGAAKAAWFSDGWLKVATWSPDPPKSRIYLPISIR